MLRDGSIPSYTDVRDIWDAYTAGGGSTCVAIADDQLKDNAKACGARFGCALCTAVGRDKSLESMIESDAAYSYMRELNRLQRYLVQTQGQLSLRNWLGRSIDADGYINIEPDTYSSEMLASLLRICLSIQEDERTAARKLRIAPRFELVSDAQLIAIDAIWSLQARHEKPFHALSIWNEVVNQGKRYYAPEVSGEAPVIEPMPARRYLYVGNWEDDATGELNQGLSPMVSVAGLMAGVGERRDQAFESLRLALKARRAAGERIPASTEKALYDELKQQSFGCLGHRTLENGSTIMDIPVSSLFSVDTEGAAMFLAFEAENYLENYWAAPRANPLVAFQTYVQYGFLSTGAKHAGTLDAMLRRAAWKVRHNLHRTATADLLNMSISKAERAAGQRTPEGQKTLIKARLTPTGR